MSKIWQKDYLLNQEVEAYCFSENAALDSKLISYDVIGSLAHAKMLMSINAISSKEFNQLEKYLLQILGLAKKGDFVVTAKDEDVHTKVENYLIEKAGEAGKKLHAGRSRNDQVLVDLKLYTKDQMLLIADAGYELVKSFLELTKKYEFVPMPGYTHMQKAMPSSLGMWAGSFAESLIDDLQLLKAAYEYNDQSPLGAGASYGVPLNINRQLTAKLLGFSKVQNNSLYTISSRLKAHLAVMQVMSQIMLTLSRFAADLLLFTTAEFDFFVIDKTLTTGSSIMPQKKNLDAMEILRARTNVLISQQQTIASIIAGLPSGYNGDFGETKKSFFESIETTLKSLKICKLVVKSIKPNIKALEKACTPELYATHKAYESVTADVPFRDAYKKTTALIESLSAYDKSNILKQSKHAGGTGNLGLNKIQSNLEIDWDWWLAQQAVHTKAIDNLMGKDNEE